MVIFRMNKVLIVYTIIRNLGASSMIRYIVELALHGVELVVEIFRDLFQSHELERVLV